MWSSQKIHLTLKEIILVVTIFIVVNGTYSFFQKQVKVNGGKGWDGIFYYELAEQMSRNQRPTVELPFAYRIGTPYLAYHADRNDLLTGFLITNLEANLLIVLLLAVWLSFQIKNWRIRILLNLVFQTTWAGPVRSIWFYQTSVDSWVIVFLLVFLILMEVQEDLGKASLITGFISFIGIFFREIIFLIPTAFLFKGVRWLNIRGSILEKFWIRTFPLLAATLGWLILTQWVSPLRHIAGYEGAHPFLNGFWVTLKNNTPDRWFLGWLGAFGPLTIIILLKPKPALLFLKDRPLVLVVLFCVAFLSIVGGHDFERFLMWLSPIFYLLLGITIESGLRFLKIGWLLGLLVGLQVLSQRLFWTIPAQVSYGPLPHLPLILLTPFGPYTNYLDITSWYAQKEVHWIKTAEYAVVGLFLTCTYFHYEKNGKEPKIV